MNSSLNIPILYEDDSIVVIDKPSGVVVNRAETVKEPTVQDWMAEKLKLPILTTPINPTQETSSEDYFQARYGLVHRLDRETSGVMVLAKNVSAFTELLRQFKEREIRKEYVALTHGIWKVKYGDISTPIGRTRQNRQMMGVREDGRPSVTEYRVEGEFTDWHFPPDFKVEDRGYAGFSLVEFRPKTGRTHQIRVHAKHMGHPLVGDFVYAGRKRSREDRKWAGRILLQAQRLSLTHPTSGQKLLFESKGMDIYSVLKYFEQQ